MTKEQLSAKIMKLAIVIGACGGITQALGSPEHPIKWLTIGLLAGFAITLYEWRKVAIVLIAEYKRLKMLESDKKHNRCTEK
ncbi:MAG: hypothetical protein NC301_09020 [Bacteroides sp.]|nr:hypothetical protein [Alistipes timonensis]MCM1311143.1 hypothetical protein [Bacteroides sp.]MCM1406259.1 hypothetical protein [[Clostridium] fimetarium]